MLKSAIVKSNLAYTFQKATDGESILFENIQEDDTADDENIPTARYKNDKTPTPETDKPSEDSGYVEGETLGSEELVKRGSTDDLDDSSVDPIKTPGMEDDTGLLKDMCDGSEELGIRITSCE